MLAHASIVLKRRRSLWYVCGMADPLLRTSRDPVIEAYKRGVDVTLLRRNLRLTPEERILQAMELARFAEEVRRAGREARRR